MRLSRLYQPRNPLFWMMIVLNLLGSGLAMLMRVWPLTAFGVALIGSLALANALLGLWLAWRLVRDGGDAGGPDVGR